MGAYGVLLFVPSGSHSSKYNNKNNKINYENTHILHNSMNKPYIKS